MKRIIKRHFIAILMVLLTITAAAAVQYVWVSSARAKLKADKAASSRTLAKLPVGTKLSVLALENRWYFVKTSRGKKGWIYRGRVSQKPPAASSKSGKKDSLGGLLAGVTGGSIRADEADTDRSIRGLSPEAREYARRTGKSERYQKAVDQLLSTQIKDAEIEQFLQKGGIGEYAQ
jgi:uncharacterized protein YgiM (DUF1202 family)